MFSLSTSLDDCVLSFSSFFLTVGLDQVTSGRLHLSEEYDGSLVGKQSSISVILTDRSHQETEEFSLVIKDFDLPTDGSADGWIEFSDSVVSPAKSFELEVFGTPDGVSILDPIESRCQQVFANDTVVNQRVPITVLSSISFEDTLNDVCAQSGSHWWIEGSSLHLDQVGQDRCTEIASIRQRYRPRGKLIQCDRWVSPGKRVKAGSAEGVVLESSIAFVQSGIVEVWILIGEPALPKRSPTWCDYTIPGTIESIDPFMVAFASGRDCDVVTQADLMIRFSKESDFQEKLPLRPGTPIRLELKVGGLSTLKPVVYVWSPGAASESYFVRSENRVDQYNCWESSASERFLLDTDQMTVEAKGVDFNEK